MMVGVLYNGKALMPTTPQRARLLITSRKATPFIHKGVFCIRLNQEPSSYIIQPISIGVDSGSKKEGISIVTEKNTVLNIQLDAITWVKEVVEKRKNARRSRRFRKTPCRKNKYLNTSTKEWLPPSTKARWQSKLNLIKSLKQIFPISICVVEDICAVTKEGQKKWNKSFSPLEVGKSWFYTQLETEGFIVVLKEGYDTANMRKEHGLYKSCEKLSDKWDAHCVDSWVLAASAMQTLPHIDKTMLLLKPMQFHRRQLHAFQPAKGGVRKLYGSTRSMGFRRGSIVSHPKYGICFIGGTSNNRISLHSIQSNERLCQNAKKNDVYFKSYNRYTIIHSVGLG
jgi:hypothetical protein